MNPHYKARPARGLTRREADSPGRGVPFFAQEWSPVKVAQLFAIEAALLLLLLIVLAPLVRADDYIGRPIWMRSGFANNASFDGCFTDPINPAPLGARVRTLTIAAAANETTVVIAHSDGYVVSVGVCASPATSTQISTVKDSNNVAFTRLGGSLITADATASAFEVWATPGGGTGNASTDVTVTYPTARLSHAFEVFVYRQVKFRSLAPFELSTAAPDTRNYWEWNKTFNSTRQVLAAVSIGNNGAGGCSGLQPACTAPGHSPDGGGSFVVNTSRAKIPCVGAPNPADCTPGLGFGGYRFDGASGQFGGWKAYQVNVSQIGYATFATLTGSPRSSNVVFGGAFLNGPEPAVIPPAPLCPGFASCWDQGIGWFWMFLFIFAMILLVMGAYKFREWGEGR